MVLIKKILILKISLFANACHKGMDLLSSQIWVKEVSLPNYYLFGVATSLGEGKLNSKQLYSALNLILCHIMLVATGLGKCIHSTSNTFLSAFFIVCVCVCIYIYIYIYVCMYVCMYVRPLKAQLVLCNPILPFPSSGHQWLNWYPTKFVWWGGLLDTQ